MRNPISILCTGEPGEGARELAAKNGVDLDIIPFTEIHFRDSDDLRQRIKTLANEDVTAVITSRSGLKGLLKLEPLITGNWRIFCLGNYYQEFDNQDNSFHNAHFIWANVSGADELADVVLQANVKKVVFFCGDQRMDILPGKLTSNGVEVEELVVYDTVASSSKVPDTYNGILFYSPAVVRSFFEQNSVPSATAAFAIGKSTAAELKKNGVENVIVPEKPGKMKLLIEAIEYLSK